jgi:hypothetical protein
MTTGWTYQKPSAFGEATDANSTALVMQALVAAGEDLAAWNDPSQALLALQVPSGAFIFNAATSSENLLATVQALPALALVLSQSAEDSAGTPWLVIGLVVVGVSRRRRGISHDAQARRREVDRIAHLLPQPQPLSPSTAASILKALDGERMEGMGSWGSMALPTPQKNHPLPLPDSRGGESQPTQGEGRGMGVRPSTASLRRRGRSESSSVGTC